MSVGQAAGWQHTWATELCLMPAIQGGHGSSIRPELRAWVPCKLLNCDLRATAVTPESLWGLSVGEAPRETVRPCRITWTMDSPKTLTVENYIQPRAAPDGQLQMEMSTQQCLPYLKRRLHSSIRCQTSVRLSAFPSLHAPCTSQGSLPT